jgi:hypothetical protein
MADLLADLAEDGPVENFFDGANLHVKQADLFESAFYDAPALKGVKAADAFSLNAESSGGGSIIVYRMRGYDTVLGQLVFWDSDIVDGTGSDYTTPGDLQGGSIRVQKVVGAD